MHQVYTVHSMHQVCTEVQYDGRVCSVQLVQYSEPGNGLEWAVQHCGMGGDGQWKVLHATLRQNMQRMHREISFKCN